MLSCISAGLVPLWSMEINCLNLHDYIKWVKHSCWSLLTIILQVLYKLNTMNTVKKGKTSHEYYANIKFIPNIVMILNQNRFYACDLLWFINIFGYLNEDVIRISSSKVNKNVESSYLKYKAWVFHHPSPDLCLEVWG